MLLLGRLDSCPSQFSFQTENKPQGLSAGNELQALFVLELFTCDNNDCGNRRRWSTYFRINIFKRIIPVFTLDSKLFGQNHFHSWTFQTKYILNENIGLVFHSRERLTLFHPVFLFFFFPPSGVEVPANQRRDDNESRIVRSELQSVDRKELLALGSKAVTFTEGVIWSKPLCKVTATHRKPQRTSENKPRQICRTVVENHTSFILSYTPLSPSLCFDELRRQVITHKAEQPVTAQKTPTVMLQGYVKVSGLPGSRLWLSSTMLQWRSCQWRHKQKPAIWITARDVH